MTVGVLALQGAFREHLRTLGRLGVDSREVRKGADLEGLEGLIIPGGESTTMGLLLGEYDLMEPLQNGDLPIFGTCAGMIVLAKRIKDSEQPRLGLMDMTVDRNHYGRQVASFETTLHAEEIGDVSGVFIRAPIVLEAGRGVRVLARHRGEIVLCEEGRCLAAAFHPELTLDTRLHVYFIDHFVRAGSKSGPR